jgi:membrane protein YqaA with SNARE-associated domain
MDLGTTGELAGLFLSAFLSATILPGTSEVALAAILTAGTASAVAAVAVATTGNALGGTLNWVIGRFFSHYRDHPRFPVKREKFERYSEVYRKWGVWSLLMSWLPLVGDALTVIAGVMRAPLLLVVVLVSIAKFARYVAVVGVVGLF